jgi:hypothetical protein
MYERFTDRGSCPRCGLPAVRQLGNQALCSMHYRFGTMRQVARKRGLAVPLYEELGTLLDSLNEMQCPHCRRVMNWHSVDGQATVISLQHYRSGQFGLICRSCNTRHAHMPGDMFNNLSIGHRWCGRCECERPLREFSTNGDGRTRSYCRECSNSRRRRDPLPRPERKAARVAAVAEMLAGGIRPMDMATTLGLSRPAISQIITRNNLRGSHV